MQPEFTLCACGCGETPSHGRRFRSGHNRRIPTETVEEAAARFWSKVDRNGPVPDYAPHLGPCWLWTAGVGSHGYGDISFFGVNWLAHRWSYEQECGPIAVGLETDHLCRVRRCVRPSHLEPVTRRVNQRRGMGLCGIASRRTHCPQGHPYAGDNLYVTPQGHRKCRACDDARALRSHPGRVRFVPKLTDDQIAEIRSAPRGRSKMLADQYGVSRSYVKSIQNGSRKRV